MIMILILNILLASQLIFLFLSNLDMLHTYTLSELTSLIASNYGISGKLSQLGGYTDRNLLVVDERSNKYVLKISSTHEDEHAVKLQNLVFAQLTNFESGMDCTFPQLFFTLEGKAMMIVEHEGKKNFFRLLSYIEGQEIWEIADPPLYLYEQISQLTAKLSLFLEKVTEKQEVKTIIKEIDSENYIFNVFTFYKDYSNYRQYLNEEIVEFVDAAKKQLDSICLILLQTPKQVIHNDICMSNLIVSSNNSGKLFLSALIDFSSMMYTYRIMELVIVSARINLYAPQPLRNILVVIKGYLKERTLSEQQKLMIFPLIKVRLAFLCLKSSYLHYSNPNDEYVNKMKQSHLHYLKTISSACSNQQFLELLKMSKQTSF